jgi:isoamylase
VTTTPPVWPGQHLRLGARWDGGGTNIAVYAPGADGLVVCLLDEIGRETRIPLPERTYGVWHGYLPGVGPGQRYGLRARGRYEPHHGLRHDESKLLADPYARAFAGSFRWDGAHATYGADTADLVPWSVILAPSGPIGPHDRPDHSWSDTVLYEVHVRGFSMRNPAVPQALRGTYAGLGHPSSIDHLVSLGVTAVELLPVFEFASEPHLQRRGLSNYWGYNTLGFFAPHASYAASRERGGQVEEFRAMVRALHAAGIEVILDVVYNHTAEGDHLGPTLSFRGLDNAGYYWLDPHDRARYLDHTGCGNAVDARSTQAVTLITDSLRYWVKEMGVDGFRFDLASTLVRDEHGVTQRAGFLTAVAQDPVLRRVKLIAEPWDIGPGGYQVGWFPPPWGEWNGPFRDTVRDVWRGADIRIGDLASRLTGSSDLYQRNGRRPTASINFVTAHDGFPMADLVSYDAKHNEANGEDNRDGEAHNRSWNGGVEGPTSDPEVLHARRSRRRAMLATLLLSAGVPMLRGGDELGATQQGNNNAYCQDNETSWLDWESGDDPAGRDRELRGFVASLIALRREHPVLRPDRFFRGLGVGDGRKDVVWIRRDGAEMTEHDWHHTRVGVLGMFLSGDGIRTRTATGEPIVDDSFLLWLNASRDAADVLVPGAPWADAYTCTFDTAAEEPFAMSIRRIPGSSRLTLAPWSVVLLKVAP